MTNVERVARHFTSDSNCCICGAALEDLDHVLCRCPSALQVWMELVRPNRFSEFMALDIIAWICANFEKPDRFPMRSTDWSLMFGSIIWFLWLDRNAKVFGAADVTVGSVVQNSHRLVLLASHVVGSRMIAMQAGAGSTRDPVL
ncbi:hypothetical protein V6N12_044963 [Hibiscus sabdariffa]|uniref:Reverse transcriptase zinc-binding domain-containing protein n=1 Tax=Hibiscus sabdariffa TaxID=183260 RepID=A0ABR2G233_9ROSI